jgi:glutamine---fructose-6-phosphate transaminase (isomerizing)
MPLSKDQAALFVSQSGETADTLASLRYCREAACRSARSSTSGIDDRARIGRRLPDPRRSRDRRRLDQGLHLPARRAGLARIRAGRRARHDHGDGEKQLVKASPKCRAHEPGAEARQPQIEKLARALKYKDVLYLGRGTSYPLALEGALKLKEISYIHAEGYAAGELKHGPIALIDEKMPVIVIAPARPHLREDRVEHAGGRARGGKIILITDEKGGRAKAAWRWRRS